ncbi:MAG: tRNA (guanosine(37)-N1)-methyltransferase TrmD [Myxococcota bacterium]
MRFEVITLFPELFDAFCRLGIIGRAVAQGHIKVRTHDLRSYGHGRHRSVDDTPYGGGPGMVLRIDSLVPCLEAVEGAAEATKVLLTPQGQRFDQARARGWAEGGRPLVLLCGRYEGFDARIHDYIDEAISVGDFVLSGGELAAQIVIDTCSRLVPGVLGNVASLDEESHSEHEIEGEYPHYTRPLAYRGIEVPEVLLSGDHARIAAWRRARARLKGSR